MKEQTLREGLDTWHEKAEGNCAIDYGFHMIVSDVNDQTLKEMEPDKRAAFKAKLPAKLVQADKEAAALTVKMPAGDEVTVPLSLIVDTEGVVVELLPGWSDESRQRLETLAGNPSHADVAEASAR